MPDNDFGVRYIVRLNIDLSFMSMLARLARVINAVKRLLHAPVDIVSSYDGNQLQYAVTIWAASLIGVAGDPLGYLHVSKCTAIQSRNER